MSISIDSSSLPNITGFSAAILTTVAFLPQLIRTLQTKSADDVSITMLLMFISGVFLWIIYGWETHALPIILANIVTLILNVSILGLKIIYSNSK